eukprot:CAMPEP_0114497678 /NCGR_PEP_ID=MMETSP0109-20121206/6462_1 /TAXON_ID=29199 /ORGANISM="Chlorarachnion reptans, Strain CCCM449" /LENGTH=1602 /DNA_ID=CAMNT_0001675095 /DNA_START=315 /DNA_END=5122 /DNA_ORIENTATION=-
MSEEKKTIVGRAANPLNKENWEDDFEIPNSLHLSDNANAYLNVLPSGRASTGEFYLGDKLDDGKQASADQLDGFFGDEDPFANMSDDDGGDDGPVEKSDQINVEGQFQAVETLASGGGEHKASDVGDANSGINDDDDDDDDDDESEDWDMQVAEELEKEGVTKPFNRNNSTKGAGLESFGGFASDSEDWTAFNEPGEGMKENTGFVQFDLGDEQDAEEDVKQYSLIKKLLSEQSQQAYNIVTYPEPPMLFSGFVKDNARSYQDEQLVSFLKGLGGVEETKNGGRGPAKKELPSVEDAKEKPKNPTGQQPRSKKHFKMNSRQRQYEVQDSPKEKVSLFTADKHDSLPTILTNCTKLVAERLLGHPEQVAVIVEDCCKFIETNSALPSITVFKDNAMSADLMYSVLMPPPSTTNSPSRIHPHGDRVLPGLRPAVQPAQVRVQGAPRRHGCRPAPAVVLSDLRQPEARVVEEHLATVGSSSTTDLSRTLDDAREGKEGVSKSERKSYLPSPSIAQQSRKGDPRTNRLRIAYRVQARALASLHLYLDNRSPIDWKELSRKAQYDPLDNDSFKWLLDAFEGKPQREGTDEQFRLTYELCGNEIHRMKILQELYVKVEPFESLEKAQAAFALAKYLSEGSLQDEAHFHSEIGVEGQAESQSRTAGLSGSSARMAEDIAFECVVVLDRLGRQREEGMCISFIETQQGVSALVLFGEILNANSKYQYAVHAFEAAIRIHRRVTGKLYYKMINMLSTLCEKHDDYQRALEYHGYILEKAKLEGNLNMYVYIVQQISKIHTKAGDFLTAVKHLRSAIEVLNQCIKEKTGGPTRETPPAARGEQRAGRPQPAPRAAPGAQHEPEGRLLPGGPHAGGAEPEGEPLPAARAALPGREADHRGDRRARVPARQGGQPSPGEDLRRPPPAGHDGLHEEAALPLLEGSDRPHAGHRAGEEERAGLPDPGGVGERVLQGRVHPNPRRQPLGGGQDAGVCCPVRQNRLLPWEFLEREPLDEDQHEDEHLQPGVLDPGPAREPALPHGEDPAGDIFQELVSHNLFPSERADTIASFPDTRECMKEFDQAYTYFDKVEDHIHIAKTLARIVETYLHVAFTAVGLLGQPHTDLTAWLVAAGFSPDGVAADDPRRADRIWTNFLDKIERPAFDSMELGLKTYHPVLYLKCLINVAEIRFLQGNYEAALKFWRECKNTFFALAMNSERCVMVDRATPGMTSAVLSVFERLVRMLMCFHPEMINLNLIVIDSFNLHSIELFADVEQCSPLRLWTGSDRASPRENKRSPVNGKRKDDSAGAEGLRKQRMLHMRGIRDDVDIFMNNDTEVMLETRRWLRQRKTPEPLTQEKHWRKHLSAFMGAVGSRSMSKSLHHDLAGSMMYDNYLDRDSYKKAIELRDKVCSLYYQISLNFNQATAGRFSRKQMTEANRENLHAIIRIMDQLRSLTYYKSGRPGGLARAFSPCASDRVHHHHHHHHHEPPPQQPQQRPRFPSRRASSVWMSEFSNPGPGVAAGGGGSGNGNGNGNSGDPLWANLTYCVTLGNVLVLYSPQLRCKMVRTVTAGAPMQGQSTGIKVEPEFMARVFAEFLAAQRQRQRKQQQQQQHQQQ